MATAGDPDDAAAAATTADVALNDRGLLGLMVAVMPGLRIEARETRTERQWTKTEGVIRFPVDPFGIPETVSPKTPGPRESLDNGIFGDRNTARRLDQPETVLRGIAWRLVMAEAAGDGTREGLVIPTVTHHGINACASAAGEAPDLAPDVQPMIRLVGLFAHARAGLIGRISDHAAAMRGAAAKLL